MTYNALVIGGTGKTGRRVVEQLSKTGHNVQVAGRNSSPFFDWSKPGSYGPALVGVDRAYVTYYPDLAVPGARQAISHLMEAAKQAGLQKVVLLSGKGEREAEACEEIVAKSGVNYTIVRASWFNQNFSESFLLEPILRGQVALPMPNARIPFVDAEDIAEVAATVLLDDQYNGQIVTVTGPGLLTFEEVVDIIAGATGRKIDFRAIDLEQYRQHLEAAQLPADYVWLLTYLFEEVLGNPANQELSTDAQRVLGRTPRSFADYAKRTAATGVWQKPELAIAEE